MRNLQNLVSLTTVNTIVTLGKSERRQILVLSQSQLPIGYPCPKYKFNYRLLKIEHETIVSNSLNARMSRVRFCRSTCTGFASKRDALLLEKSEKKQPRRHSPIRNQNRPSSFRSRIEPCRTVTVPPWFPYKAHANFEKLLVAFQYFDCRYQSAVVSVTSRCVFSIVDKINWIKPAYSPEDDPKAQDF